MATEGTDGVSNPNVDEIKQEMVDAEDDEYDTGIRTTGQGQAQMKPKHNRVDTRDREPGESPWMQNMFTKIYQDLRALSKDFRVPITVPELLFFGFQSSGKTSTLSILAKTPAGTMSDGTGTRCPVRYTLTHNEELIKPRLSVNRIQVANFQEQTKAIMDHMQSLANNSSSKFSDEILEATIESRDVPNIIFVDMPGLIKKSNIEKYKDWKMQLERITSKLGTSRTADGESFAFIPVFVREAYDIENDDGYEIEKIDELFRDKRPYWREDTLFIINKFDTKGNRKDSESFIRYIKNLINEGETVITCANPGGERVSAMTGEELSNHIRDVPNKEERWWREIIGDFRRKADPFVDQLQDLRESVCGVGIMNSILVDKMCAIVKNTLPLLQSQLEKREQEYQDYIAKLQKDMELDDPEKLRQRVSEFNHKFLEALKEFYQGRDLAAVRHFRQTWGDDMKHFHNPKRFRTIHQTARDWDRGTPGISGGSTQGFYISPRELEDLLVTVDRQDLVHECRSGLLGGVAVRRALKIWVFMISVMPFPDYTHEDILNFGDPFDGTIQADPWKIVRNVVYHASISLRKGCIWFGEYLRYRLKSNADIVFQTCLADEFRNSVKAFGTGHGAAYGNFNGNIGNFGGSIGNDLKIRMNAGNRNRGGGSGIGMNNRRRNNIGGRRRQIKGINMNININGDGNNRGNNLIGSANGPGLGSDLRKRNKSDQDLQKLLEIGLKDYKKLVDIMVNEFQAAVEVIPADQAEILDRKFHEDIINLSELLLRLLEDDMIDTELTELEQYADGLNNDRQKTKLKDNKQRKFDAKNRRQEQIKFESESQAVQEKQTMVRQSRDSVVNKDNNKAKTEVKDNNNGDVDVDKVLEEEDDPFAENDDNKEEENPFDNNNNINDNGNKMGNTTYNSIGAQHMRERERYMEHAFNDLENSRDIAFYKTLFPSKPKRQYHHMNDQSTYLIKKLAKVVWTCIKKHVISTAQQTLTNRVLAELKGHGKKCHSALLIGIDWPHIQRLVGQLEEKTKIPRSQIEKMIKEESKIPQQKGVGQMSNEEIREVYGSKIKEIEKEYDKMLLEYKAFLKKKEEIKAKIEALQSMDVTEDID